MRWVIWGRLVAAGVLLVLGGGRGWAQADGEEFKRLAGEVADLREANVALQRRMAQLESKTEALENALREANERAVANFGTVATREDLTKMGEMMRDLDQKREADRKLILDQLEKLSLGLNLSTEVSRSGKKGESKSASAAPAKPFEGNVLKYRVQSGDMLEKVLRTFNQQLKEDGRPRVTFEQVLAANPGLNPNNLLAGKEILLPVPDKKDAAPARKSE